MFINALSLRRSILAKTAGRKCELCVCEIRPGDRYRVTGAKSAHEFCYDAVAREQMMRRPL